MNRKILCVDDDENVLASFRRQLRKQFEVETALGGQEGLELLNKIGPVAVIISDMRMPGMDGIQFLTKVKDVWADTVRIMLTGNADLMTAIESVNEGNIFRFLIKPCPIDILIKSLEAGIEQYRLICAERDLLKNTLTGSIKVLVEILSLVNPLAFSRASRIRDYVKHIVTHLELSDAWKYEVAAMLSQLGCVTIPPEIMNKIYSQVILTSDEKSMYSAHPLTGRNLIANIPRLESIAQMIEGQQRPFSLFSKEEDLKLKVISFGAQILKAVIDFDQFVYSGFSYKSAIATLESRKEEYNPVVLEALKTLEVDKFERRVKSVHVSDLRFGMVAHEDIHAKNGFLLAAKGQEITYPVIERIQNFSKKIGVDEPFKVIVR
jgi:response regulator RpfG family c-di-GMP phosphodiesterase